MIKVTPSPLTTHAFNPNRIPLPCRQHDLVEWISADGSNCFETIAAARKEDRRRARRLLRSTDPNARALGRWLETATAARLLPLSPVSSFYMRTCRRKLLGAVMAHIYGEGLCDTEVKAFTLIHPAWFYKAGTLHEIDPKAIRKHLRRCFDRVGITAAEGALWAALHGEFDGNGYQLHFHGVAAGAKATLICKLYSRNGFDRTADIQQPINCKDVYDLSGWLSYCMKSYWPQRLKYIDKHGKPRRGRKQGLQRPQLEEFLMWMSKQHLLSLIIHSGFSSTAWGHVGNGKL